MNTHLITGGAYILLGIPSNGRPVSPTWAVNYASQQFPMNATVIRAACYGRPTDEARNKFAELALEHKCKYLAMLDDDIEPRIYNALPKMIKALEDDNDAGMIAAVCALRTDPVEPNVYMAEGSGPYTEWKPNQVFSVWGVGFGLVLIKTEVLRNLDTPHFKFTQTRTEDLDFCNRVGKLGLKVLVHGGVVCDHRDLDTGIQYCL